MEMQVTRPQIRRLLHIHDEVELCLYTKGKDPNHILTALLVMKIKDISELDGRCKEAFKKFSGHSQFSMAVNEIEWYLNVNRSR